jgi:hypothetical protein
MGRVPIFSPSNVVNFDGPEIRSRRREEVEAQPRAGLWAGATCATPSGRPHIPRLCGVTRTLTLHKRTRSTEALPFSHPRNRVASVQKQ